MKELTTFQMACESKLVDALRKVGLRLDDRILDGNRETYIRAIIQNTDYTVFIYDNEAGIQGINTDLRFESPDFDTDEQLINVFVNKVISLVK